jgi:hypothetical protein
MEQPTEVAIMLPPYFFIVGIIGVNMAKKKKAVKETTYTAEQIVTMVNKKLNSTSFTELVQQQEDDFNLFSLVKYEAEPDHQSYTSPAPKNDFLKVYHGVNKASLTWQIVTPEDAPDKEREAANLGERLLCGIINIANRQLSKVGEPELREGTTWFACQRGMSALKCLIYADESKDTRIDIRYIDPMHLAWELGADGLVWAGYTYHISPAEAKERYGVDLTEGKDAVIIDFFTRSENAVVLAEGTKEGNDSSQFVKEPTKHGLDHVPIWLGFAGGMPTVYTSNNEETLKHRASSVYASSRGIYEPRNKQISFIMDVAEKSVAGTLLYASEDGKKDIKGDPWGAWQVIKIKKDKEDLAPLIPAPVPQASAAILSVIDRDMQESTVPYPIGYGIDPGAHSGTALHMMNENTKSAYGPFTALLENGFLWLCEEILTQFKTKGQKMSLKGFDTNGKFFVLDANPKDIEDDWYINVTCEPKLPRDEAGEMQMALMATQTRPPFMRPLISDYTAREEILHLKDADAEDERIEEQQIRYMIEQMPNIQVKRVARELLEQGDRDGALELLSSMPSPQGQQSQGQGQSQGQIPPEAMQALQQAAQILGLPPEQVAQMPPEQVQAMIEQKMRNTGG